MSVLHIDYETFFDEAAGVSLKKMALLAYLRVAPVIGFSFAVDHGPFEWVPSSSTDFLPTLQDIDDFCQEPGNILNAYNTPFDARCGVYGRLEPYGEPFGMRWPLEIHDSMEFMMAAYPHTAGGYSLRNVAQWLHLPPKLSIDDAKKGRCTWESYCNRDGELLQAIYYRTLDRLSPEEIFYATNCGKVRGLAYQINEHTVEASLKAFTENTRLGVEAATAFLSNYARDGEDLSATIFGGYEEGKVRSVKAKALKELLIGALGFDTTSTSLKKINPAHLAARPDVATLLTATTKANKGLYYQKRAQALMGTTEVPMEKGYFRAATGRTSAPTTGRGVNCLTGDTPIHTHRGLKRLDAVLDDDLVWDGQEFVAHGGLVYRGQRTCLTLAGLTLTPDHRILTTSGWRTAQWLAQEPTTTLSVPDMGVESFSGTRPTSATPGTIDYATAVTAALKEKLLRLSSSKVLSARSALSANGSGATRSSPTTPSAVAGSSVGTGSSSGSSTPATPSTLGTGAEASRCTQPGSTTPLLFSRTSPHSVAISGPSRSPSSTPSTGRTTTGTTSRGTCDSSVSRQTTRTKSTSESVYDLLDCGPRARFVAGSVIVHNCANLTKKDKSIAKPLRQMLALPDHLCYVQADASNAEYRTEGWLTNCKYVREMFEKNIEADPYSAFGVAGFGVLSVKGEPLRDVVSKAAVLGYGYGMGKIRAMEELNKAVADPINKVSVQQIEALCHSRGWKPPTDRYLKGAISRTKCHWSVGIAAYEAREAFHAIHPEFFATADWLQTSVSMLSASKDPEYLIDRLYQLPGAPNRDMINLGIDKELEFPTIRVTLLGHSMPTVTWRQLSCSHPGVDGLGLITANKGPRNVHRALLIENVCQSAARIGLLRCENELARRGYLTDSVYDSILVICPREREAILQARADLLDVMGPRGPHRMGWAFYAKPSEITVTKTRYEDEKEAAICFAKLEANDPTWTEHLT